MKLLVFITVVLQLLSIAPLTFALSNNIDRSVAIIPISQNGSFEAIVKINNQSIKGIIDTGATTVAINSNQAHELNITYDKNVTIWIETASGRTKAHQAIIASIELEGVQIANVPVTIIEGNLPSTILLGMNYLKNFDIRLQKDTITIYRINNSQSEKKKCIWLSQ